MDFIPPPEWLAIETRTSTYDCLPALRLAMGALPAAGGRVRSPAGKFRFSDTINLKKMVVLDGEGTGEDGAAGTEWEFPNDRDWIVVNRSNTLGNGIDPNPGPRADGSIIRGLLLSTATRGTAGHGIRLRARASIYDCRIDKAGQDAINIVASWNGDAATIGNANNWRVSRVRLTGPGRHGLFIQGGDANAGLADAVDVEWAGGWGVYDSSFLGNTHDGHHASGNTLGAYKADNPNAHCVFTGCYSEQGQPKSDFMVGRHLILGGTHGAGCNVGDQSLWMHENFITPFWVVANNTVRDLSFGFVPGIGGVSYGATGDQGYGLQFPFWHEEHGTWEARHSMLDARVAFELTTALTTLKDGNAAAIPPGNIVFPNGFWVPDGASGHYKKITL